VTAIDPTCDLFASFVGAIDPDVLAGLDALIRAPPLWSLDRGTLWIDVVARVRTFAERWDGPARTCGWSALQLYGVDRRAPGARLSSLGSAWVAARSAFHVLEVTPNIIRVATRSASRLSIYKLPSDPGAVLAWDLVTICHRAS
jgi:hypothetical protein